MIRSGPQDGKGLRPALLQEATRRGVDADCGGQFDGDAEVLSGNAEREAAAVRGQTSWPRTCSASKLRPVDSLITLSSVSGASPKAAPITSASTAADSRARPRVVERLVACPDPSVPVRTELLAYFDEPTQTATPRGVINKVKVIKRRAYGLPSFEGLRQRMLLACA
jgi:hypothetical protein